MTVRAPAKINWFLYVLGRRDDGFHDILSPVQKISLYDTLSFEPADRIEVRDGGGIDDNIIFRVVDVLRRFRPSLEAGMRIDIAKDIPLSGGLGGGSSDAAAALCALNRLWDIGLSDGEMEEAAAMVGSDVPFFLGGGFSVISGRGEIVRSYEMGQCYDLLLVNPGIRVSTAWAYRENRDCFSPGDADGIVEAFIRALEGRDFASLREMMFNSLERPVFSAYPSIAELKDDMKRAGAKAAMMSGSGATVFGVFEDRESALRAGERFRGLWHRVVQTIGPEPC